MSEPKMVASDSDERTVNNVMRHQYRVLEEHEKQNMLRVKDLGLQLYNMLHDMGGTRRDEDKFGSRELSLAATNLEQAVMWAVKHVTR